MRIRLLFSLILAVVLAVAVFVSASANGQETCPQDGNWVKVDGLGGFSFTYTAPEGNLITGWCYKAGTSVVYGVVDPPQQSFTVVSTVGHELSHASFRIEKDDEDPTPTPTDLPTFTPTATDVPTNTPTATPTDVVVTDTPTATPTEGTPPVTVTPPTFTPTPTGTPTMIATPKKPVCKSIPECGGRMEEWAKAKNNLVHVFYAKGDCSKKIGNRFCYDPSQIVSWIYMRSEKPYFLLPSADMNIIAAEMAANNAETNPEFKMSYSVIQVKGVMNVAPVQQVSPDGKGGTVTYYIIDMPSAFMGGDWEIKALDANGNAVPYREVYGVHSVDKYISCSRSAGLWDVDSNGNVTKFKYGGYNSWDWFWYLYKSADWEFGDAMKWSLDFWIDGTGVLPVQ